MAEKTEKKSGGGQIIKVDADSGKRFEGTISSISYLSEKPDEGSTSSGQQSAQYVAYVDFTPDETVRIGMTVIVYVE